MSLLLTRMQNLRSGSNLDKYELRASRYGAFDLFVSQTNDPSGIITPELKQKAAMSMGNILQTAVFDFDSVITINNVRSAVIVDDENTSRMIDITFATFAFGFTQTPASFLNNEKSLQQDFERKLMKYVYGLAGMLDTTAVAALELRRSQILKDRLLYTFNPQFTVRATFPQRETIIGDLDPLMASNDFYGPIHVLGNAGFESLIRQLTEKGLYNVENKQLQFSDKILHFSNRIPNAPAIITPDTPAAYATGYVVNGGSVGILNRVEPESLLGTKAATGHVWGIERLPVLDLEVGTYYYESVGDFSAIAGAASAHLTRARKDHYGFAVDLAFMVAYNSAPTTTPEPILKFDVATS